MARKNFHSSENPKKAALEFLNAELAKGFRVFWDKGHIQNHDHGGIGIVFASGAEARGFDEHPSRYMPVRTVEDIDEVFTFYEDDE